jgi:hypothetical protein
MFTTVERTEEVTGRRIGRVARRAALVVVLAAAGLGIVAGPASASRSEACTQHLRYISYIQHHFMVAYNSWDQAGMDYWLSEYENTLADAEGVC